MNPVPCRDCGYVLDPDSRGCPRCARNLDAERAVARCLRRAGGLLLLLAALFIFAAAYFTLYTG